MKAALPVKCDLLIIETTFGAPLFRFPKRNEVALDMVRWAVMEVIPSGRIPAFKTDSIGNAQEIIHIFNTMTKVPVVTARSTTRVSNIYRKHGHVLDYIDAKSDEGQELLESGGCIFITSKGSRLKQNNFDTALASGWAVMMRNRRKAFPLSDHADFRELLRFIRHCHPKRVLTFHGGPMTKGFTDYVKKRLNIDARPLTSREETLKGPVNSREMRMKACYDQLLRTIKIPGFEYTPKWLIREMARKGFTRGETESALNYLLERKTLERTSNGVSIPRIP
jgi:Cft2 family RNA processing exonuclease